MNFFKWLTATPCERFGHSTIPYRRHDAEGDKPYHLYGWYCTRCKKSV